MRNVINKNNSYNNKKLILNNNDDNSNNISISNETNPQLKLKSSFNFKLNLTNRSNFTLFNIS